MRGAIAVWIVELRANSFSRELRRPTSYPKQSAVVRLDLLARSFDAGGVLLDGLDVAERRATRFLLDQRMHRAQGAEIDDELLTFGRKAIALEKARGVRIGRVLEQSIRTDDERRAFRRIDDLDRPAAFLALQHVVFAAVSHHRPLAERELLGRIGRRLHLHHLLLGELLEIPPAELAHDLERRRQNSSAIARMRLDDLTRPFGIE